MLIQVYESTISYAALHTKGAAGPSGLDADGWRRILVSKNFGEMNFEPVLQKWLVLYVREILIQTPVFSIEAYLSCRLIPLDKRPGVRPIAIGE